MGMTIDDALAEYNAWKITISENVSPDCVDALDTAIEIMHKYQQIEQILDDCDLVAWEVLEMIKEVVADGNDTTNKRRTKSIP